MKDRIYDYWAATLQDGYIGQLINIVGQAGGARALYAMTKEQMTQKLGITPHLAGYIAGHRPDISRIEADYYIMQEKGISYVNHTDKEYPEKLQNIAGRPYGLFLKGAMPDPLTSSVAIIGARECSEYGRLMADYFGSRLAAEGVQIISGMAWGIDGIAQASAINAGGRSFAVLGCGVDIIYPAKNRALYEKLCRDNNGIISEYAPSTEAIARKFPPRNRLISGLCDVLIVIEARAKSGTLITVDMAVDQGRTVMVVPGRLTDKLSVGCLNLLKDGAICATGIESVMEQLGINRKKKVKHITVSSKKSAIFDPETSDLSKVLKVLDLDPQSTEEIAAKARVPVNAAMIALTKLEVQDLAREVAPGYFIKIVRIS